MGGPGRAPISGPMGGAGRAPGSGPLGARDRANARAAQPDAAALRWSRPDWLSSAPPSGGVPPTDLAPPTTPRYSEDRQGAAYYQPREDEPPHGETDYRATGVRARLWASRTPSYEPDRPPEPIEPDASVERAYFEAFNSRHTPAALAHREASLSGNTGTYTPGATSEVERLRRDAEVLGKRTNGPAPYFWELMNKPRPKSQALSLAFWLVTAFTVFATLVTGSYAGISIYAASQLIYAPQVAAKGTPADAGLAYKDVMFVSRTDHLLLRGWFIPGVDGQGQLTSAKTIIMVHGIRTNRADPGVGLLPISEALAKSGFAVLTFDLRGSGTSSSAPTTLGYFEQRDILGAVDFLRAGDMPYPTLGRPQAIGGWGVSMGASSLLLAAAQEPALRAIVSDSAFADITPILEREIPARSHLPHFVTPGVMTAASTMYGIDFKDTPASVVMRIAPRPILFIHGASDTYVPPGNMTTLAQAARAGTNAHIDTWLVPNATHAQAYHVTGQAYVDRVVAFFTANLSPAK